MCRLRRAALGNEELGLNEHAKRKSTYRYDELGQLVMSVSMTSEKLASPIEYELVYAKAAPQLGRCCFRGKTTTLQAWATWESCRAGCGAKLRVATHVVVARRMPR